MYLIMGKYEEEGGHVLSYVCVVVVVVGECPPCQ